MMPDYDIPIVADDQREIDPVFRQEIDHLFKAMVMDYRKQKGRIFFPSEDCAPIIDIPVGPIAARLEMINLYINPEGECFGEEDSLLTT